MFSVTLLIVSVSAVMPTLLPPVPARLGFTVAASKAGCAALPMDAAAISAPAHTAACILNSFLLL
jgi:hypothetical protein